MMFPLEVLAWWAVVAVVTALLAWRFPRARLVWLGLAVIAAATIYFRTVMAHRPPNYYALLEFLASSFAGGGGFVMATVGGFHLLTAKPADRSA
jgi:hypothetical protein